MPDSAIKQIRETNCSTCASIATINDYLLRTDYWLVILANNQAHLGRSFTTLRRHAGSLSALTHAEWQDFERIVRRIEKAYTGTFVGIRSFNWTCLMNNAFKAEQPQPHVHWHVRPRRNDVITINNVAFADPDYGHHYDRTREQLVDKDTWETIAAQLRDALHDSTVSL